MNIEPTDYGSSYQGFDPVRYQNLEAQLHYQQQKQMSATREMMHSADLRIIGPDEMDYTEDIDRPGRLLVAAKRRYEPHRVARESFDSQLLTQETSNRWTEAGAEVAMGVGKGAVAVGTALFVEEKLEQMVSRNMVGKNFQRAYRAGLNDALGKGAILTPQLKRKIAAEAKRKAFSGAKLFGKSTVGSGGRFAATIGRGSVVAGATAASLGASLAIEAAVEGGLKYVGVEKGINQFKDINEIRNISDSFMLGGAGDYQTGRVARSEAQDIQRFMAKDDVMNSFIFDGADMEDLKREVSTFTETGLLQGVRNAEDFKKKFGLLKESVRKITEVLGTSFEESVKMMQDYRNMGLDPSKHFDLAQDTRLSAAKYGMSIDVAHAAGVKTSLALQGTGLTAGAAVRLGVTAQGLGERLFQGQGYLDDKVKYNLGGTEEGVRMAIERGFIRQTSTMQNQLGMAYAFQDGEFSRERMLAVAAGDVSVSEMSRNIGIRGVEDMVRFNANRDQALSDMMEDSPEAALAFAVMPTITAIEEYSGKSISSMSSAEQGFYAEKLFGAESSEGFQAMVAGLMQATTGDGNRDMLLAEQGENRAYAMEGGIIARFINKVGQNFVPMARQMAEVQENTANTFYDISESMSDEVQHVFRGKDRVQTDGAVIEALRLASEELNYSTKENKNRGKFFGDSFFNSESDQYQRAREAGIYDVETAGINIHNRMEVDADNLHDMQNIGLTGFRLLSERIAAKSGADATTIYERYLANLEAQGAKVNRGGANGGSLSGTLSMIQEAGFDISEGQSRDFERLLKGRELGGDHYMLINEASERRDSEDAMQNAAEMVRLAKLDYGSARASDIEVQDIITQSIRQTKQGSADKLIADDGFAPGMALRNILIKNAGVGLLGMDQGSSIKEVVDNVNRMREEGGEENDAKVQRFMSVLSSTVERFEAMGQGGQRLATVFTQYSGDIGLDADAAASAMEEADSSFDNLLNTAISKDTTIRRGGHFRHGIGNISLDRGEVADYMTSQVKTKEDRANYMGVVALMALRRQRLAEGKDLTDEEDNLLGQFSSKLQSNGEITAQQSAKLSLDRGDISVADVANNAERYMLGAQMANRGLATSEDGVQEIRSGGLSVMNAELKRERETRDAQVQMIIRAQERLNGALQTTINSASTMQSATEAMYRQFQSDGRGQAPPSRPNTSAVID